MLRNKSLLALMLSALFFIPGCPKDEKKKDDDKEEKSSKKKKGDDDDDDDKGKKKKKKDDDDKAASDDAPKVGIKACDDYLEKMSRCIKKAPAAARDGMKARQAAMANAWKEGAKTGAGAESPAMKSSCEASLKSAKDANKAICPGVFDEE